MTRDIGNEGKGFQSCGTRKVNPLDADAVLLTLIVNFIKELVTEFVRVRGAHQACFVVMASNQHFL